MAYYDYSCYACARTNTIDRGSLLEDLKQILEPDILHLFSLLLTDVQLEVKHKKKLVERFKPDIGSPQGDCASPIWFIFYLHKAMQSIKLAPNRNIEIDIRHDHNYTKADKHRTTPKVQKIFNIDQQYADDTSLATTSKALIVNGDKTEEYSISRTSNPEWKKCRYLG